MAMQLGGGLGGSKSREFQNAVDINITPFVDVMLVLLIIFMVAAPLATVSVKVDLPPSNALPTPNPQDPVFISLQKTGQLYLGDTEVTLGTLTDVLNERTQNGEGVETRIFVRADKQVQYGEVMRVFNVLQDAGYYKLALVGEEVVD